MNRVLRLLAGLLICGGVFAEEGESTFLKNVRQLTFQGKTGEGYFSPDGRHLIFQSVREPGNPFYQMYILDFETGDVHRVSPGEGKTTCGFFQPGSDRVLFASTHHDAEVRKKTEEEIAFQASGKKRRYSWDYDPAMDIFSADRDGSNLKQLTDAPGYDAEAAYSPDGKHIIFSSLRSAYPLEELSAEDRKRYEMDPAFFADLYIMNADGSGVKRLTATPGYDGGPFFSPDGERVIWRRFDEGGLIANVYSMKTDGSDVRQVTDFESMSWAPYPHPSGEYIVFTSNKHGFENFELFIVDSDGGGEPVRVTFTDGFDGLPVFSPDGKKLCWTSNRKGQSQLYLAEWNHSAALSALGSVSEGAIASTKAGGKTDAKEKLSPEIRAGDARALVERLASDEFEGRKTGEPGALKAAEFINARFKAIGLESARNIKAGGQEASALPYFQPFDFAAGVEITEAKTELAVSSGGSKTEFQVNENYRPFAFSSNGEVEAPVVFAGYGLSVPGELGEGYDSYAGLDVTNKVVLVFRYAPEGVSPERRQELLRYAAFRYKAMIARERGAKALLVVSGPNSPKSGELIPLASLGATAGSDILAASITTEVAEKLLAGTGKTLKDLQTALDTENPHAEMGMELPETTVRLAIELEHQRDEDRNVIGVIPGSSNEFVMVGGHYDHLGHGDSADSRGRSGEEGQIHNGADDNASGVATVLELAAHFAEEIKPGSKPKRGIIFALWSGEEMGILGSSAFAENPPVPLTNIVAYLNFDMVGRLRENKLSLQGAGSSSVWRKLIERKNVAAGFNATVQDDPYLPTDTTAFYSKGIPVLNFFTGSHDEYHRPTDDPDTLNYEGIERITKLARSIVEDLITAPERPDLLKVERSSAPGNRDALRTYIGSIPDYATEVKGVKLSGVRGGSPAEKGGLRAGDVIVEFAGQGVANIYDYTYALDAAKIGEAVKVKVLRDGKEVELTVTPEARE